MEIKKIKNLLYSGQEINVDLAISIMEGFGLDWTSAGFEEEKELVDLCGCDVFTTTKIILIDLGLKKLPKSICKLQRLEWLDLGKNNINHIPQDIVKLQRLEWLSLYKNNLSTLPRSIWEMGKLKQLNLAFNPLPYSIISQTKAYIPTCNIYA